MRKMKTLKEIVKAVKDVCKNDIDIEKVKLYYNKNSKDGFDCDEWNLMCLVRCARAKKIHQDLIEAYAVLLFLELNRK